MPRISRRADRCEGSKSDVALYGSGLNFSRAEPVDDAVTPGAHSVHCREASHQTIGETKKQTKQKHTKTKPKKNQKQKKQTHKNNKNKKQQPHHTPRAAV